MYYQFQLLQVIEIERQTLITLKVCRAL